MPTLRLPRLRDLLHRFAGTRPLRIIEAETLDASGVDTGPSPLFERYFLCEIPRWMPRFGGGAVYLHHYLRSDPDRGVHDHPWDHALAVQLAGGYVEERLNGFSHEGIRKRYVARRPGRGYLLKGSDFHRVLVPEGAATSWSLFAHGPYRKGWGFLQDEPEFDFPGAKAIYFRPFKNENDGNSRWWRDRWKHPPGREQSRADADGRHRPHPEPVEGRGREAARMAERFGREDARLRAQLKVARENGVQ